MKNVCLLFGNVYIDCISVEIKDETLVCVCHKNASNFARLAALEVNLDIDGDENYLFDIAYDRVAQVRYL